MNQHGNVLKVGWFARMDKYSELGSCKLDVVRFPFVFSCLIALLLCIYIFYIMLLTLKEIAWWEYTVCVYGRQDIEKENVVIEQLKDYTEISWN